MTHKYNSQREKEKHEQVYIHSMLDITHKLLTLASFSFGLFEFLFCFDDFCHYLGGWPKIIERKFCVCQFEIKMIGYYPVSF